MYVTTILANRALNSRCLGGEGQGPSLGHRWRLVNLKYVPQAPKEVDMVKDGEHGGKKENTSREVESGKSMCLTLSPNHAAGHKA